MNSLKDQKWLHDHSLHSGSLDEEHLELNSKVILRLDQ